MKTAIIIVDHGSRNADSNALLHTVAQRFFELYCETWRRSVLNLKGSKKWWQWAAHARPQHWVHLARVLLQTQRMMDVPHYVREHRLAPVSE